MNKTIMMNILACIVFISMVSAAGPIGWWLGYAHINGTLAPNGTTVNAYVNGVWEADSTVGDLAELGGYNVAVEGEDGDTITLKICDVAVEQGTQSYSSGGHFLNISIGLAGFGTTCTKDCACAEGNCLDGACRPANCGDGSCASTETSTNCPQDCSSSGGGGSSGGSGSSDCFNGRDDDGDGLVDMADPGCDSKNDDNEFNVPPTTPTIPTPTFRTTSSNGAPEFTNFDSETTPTDLGEEGEDNGGDDGTPTGTDLGGITGAVTGDQGGNGTPWWLWGVLGLVIVGLLGLAAFIREKMRS